MRLSDNVRDNLLFLIAEAAAQLANLQVLMDTSSQAAAQRILDRRGYAYNLKMRIHESSVDELRRLRARQTSDLHSLRAAEAIASELERLIDLGHDCARQISGQTRRGCFKLLSKSGMTDDLMAALQLVKTGIEEPDTKIAFKISAKVDKLATTYETFNARRAKDLKKRKHPEDIVAVLFVSYRIKEMGEVLLDVSDAILAATLGQPMPLERFRSLEDAVSELDLKEPEVTPIAETKSGSGISGISDKTSNGDGYAAIFKDGDREKLKEERDSVESWHDIFPGLAPKILSYRKRGPHASMLIEHLPGNTFEHVLLHESDTTLQNALKHLGRTLNSIWSETKRKKKSPANHMGQLQQRLPNVQEVHGGFGRSVQKLCGAETNDLCGLIATAETLEAKLPPPFSVYIHGDFNLDNIIFDAEAKRIRFIDLHRSMYADYVQDVSVFMVSAYRLQVLDKETRRRIKETVLRFHDMASAFSQTNKDTTFELRLGLGLARSFITSTRFILDKSLAKTMYLRGQYLLERITTESPKSAPDFTLPLKDLF